MKLSLLLLLSCLLGAASAKVLKTHEPASHAIQEELHHLEQSIQSLTRSAEEDQPKLEHEGVDPVGVDEVLDMLYDVPDPNILNNLFVQNMVIGTYDFRKRDSVRPADCSLTLSPTSLSRKVIDAIDLVEPGGLIDVEAKKAVFKQYGFTESQIEEIFQPGYFGSTINQMRNVPENARNRVLKDKVFKLSIEMDWIKTAKKSENEGTVGSFVMLRLRDDDKCDDDCLVNYMMRFAPDLDLALSEQRHLDNGRIFNGAHHGCYESFMDSLTDESRKDFNELSDFQKVVFTAYYVPYLSIKSQDDLNNLGLAAKKIDRSFEWESYDRIGYVDIPAHPDYGDGDPRIVLTGAMNGCSLYVVQISETTLRVFHDSQHLLYGDGKDLEPDPELLDGLGPTLCQVNHVDYKNDEDDDDHHLWVTKSAFVWMSYNRDKELWQVKMQDQDLYNSNRIPGLAVPLGETEVIDCRI